MNDNNEIFRDDVRKGLHSSPKSLPSKYFYDDEGSRIFREIMDLEEYYLTDSEWSIFDSQAEQMRQAFMGGHEGFELVELGAGDGLKTKILLRHFLSMETPIAYRPVDISLGALEALDTELREEFPELDVEIIHGDWIHALDLLAEGKFTRNVIMFLGANIGNLDDDVAILFLREIRRHIRPTDQLMIGFDLKKDPERIRSAYHDSKGVTRRFNLNLLERINRELGADFSTAAFDFFPSYDPESGQVRSYLLSLKDQMVNIPGIGEIPFRAWETIHTEISRKYSISEIEQLAADSGFRVIHHFTDDGMLFTDSLWEMA